MNGMKRDARGGVRRPTTALRARLMAWALSMPAYALIAPIAVGREGN